MHNVHIFKIVKADIKYTKIKRDCINRTQIAKKPKFRTRKNGDSL